MGTVIGVEGNEWSFTPFSFMQQLLKCLPHAGNELPSGVGGIYLGGLGGMRWEPMLVQHRGHW